MQVNKIPETRNFVDTYNSILLFATDYAEKGDLDDSLDIKDKLENENIFRSLVDILVSDLEAIETYGIRIEDLLSIAKLCVTLEKFDVAEDFFNLTLELSPTEEQQAEISYELGLLCKNDDMSKAIEYFKQALKYYRKKLKESKYKEPAIINTILELAEKDLKDKDLTYSIYKELFEYFPHDADYKEKYADQILQNKDSRYWDEAESIYRELLKDYSYENYSWIKLGKLYEKKGERKKAEETFKEGLKKSKHFSLLYLEYGEFLERQKKKKEALKIYESLLKENKWEKDYFNEIAQEKIELLSEN